jgi:hypothetical protein
MDWKALNQSRRVWSPNEPTSERSSASRTISRCLALTPLEPAVADFIANGLSKADLSKLDPGVIETLRRNIEDEEKHELALNRAKAAMVDYDPSFEVEAQEIIQAWKDLPDPEIVKAALMENSIFFLILPAYSNFGGAALRITSNSISADERIHVISHRTAAQQLGIRPSKAINKLRKDTVEFLFSDLEEEAGSKWTLDRMMKNSDNLLKRGVTDLVETAVGTVLAPFQISNSSLDKYS